MVKIVLGTTPTIKYKFSIVDPADFSEAVCRGCVDFDGRGREQAFRHDV